jgi:hypothetical protein
MPPPIDPGMFAEGVAVNAAVAIAIVLGVAVTAEAVPEGETVTAGQVGVPCNASGRRLPGSRPALPVSGIKTRDWTAAATGCGADRAGLATIGVFAGQDAVWACATAPPRPGDATLAVATTDRVVPAATSVEIASLMLLFLPCGLASNQCRKEYVEARSADLSTAL